VTETTTTGFLGNIGNAIVGVLVGIVMFFGSFVVLYYNEGMVNVADVAKKAAVAPAEKADPANEAKLVSVTSTLESKEDVGDPSFVKPGAWIALSRKVEMFANLETKHEETKKNTGGSSTTTTTWTYATGWSDSPSATDSSKFKEKGHDNPLWPFGNAEFKVENATVGAYSVHVKGDDLDLPPGDSLSLTPAIFQIGAAPAALPAEANGATNNTNAPAAQTIACPGCGETRPLSKANCPHCGAPASDKWTTAPAGTATPSAGGAPHIDGNYVFVGSGSLASPRIGDVRASYLALARSLKVTLFGQQKGSNVEPFAIEGGDFLHKRLFRALKGTREEAIQELAFEDAMRLWILRGVGFLLMWIGMSLVFGPITAVMDVFPSLGGFVKAVIGIVLFPIALVLTGVTIVVAKILHSVIAMVIVGLLVFGLVFIVLKSMKKKSTPPAAPATA
jgi:hypothetical protein